MLETLFIIGNGFDCYCHEMKTKYSDFREHVLRLYPESKEYAGVPEMTMTLDHHDYAYNKKDIAVYIVHIMDQCQGEEWSNLESALGSDIFDEFEDEFEYINWNDENDSSIFTSLNNNQEIGRAIGYTFYEIKQLFYDWIETDLANIVYENIHAQPVFKDILTGKAISTQQDAIGYIDFNYTYTLERVYGISNNQVWNIHGKVGDDIENIYFGHGNENLDFEVDKAWGEKDTFPLLAEKLKKNTSQVIANNISRFEKYAGIKCIYSSGFSFSDVDMVYIEKLCEYINPQNVTWYFNTYDAAENSKYLDKIKKLGFDIAVENRW